MKLPQVLPSAHGPLQSQGLDFRFPPGKVCIGPTSRAPGGRADGDILRPVQMNCKWCHTAYPGLRFPSLAIPFGRTPPLTCTHAQHQTLSQTQLPPHTLSPATPTPSHPRPNDAHITPPVSNPPCTCDISDKHPASKFSVTLLPKPPTHRAATDGSQCSTVGSRQLPL